MITTADMTSTSPAEAAALEVLRGWPRCYTIRHYQRKGNREVFHVLDADGVECGLITVSLAGSEPRVQSLVFSC